MSESPNARPQVVVLLAGLRFARTAPLRFDAAIELCPAQPGAVAWLEPLRAQLDALEIDRRSSAVVAGYGYRQLHADADHAGLEQFARFFGGRFAAAALEDERRFIDHSRSGILMLEDLTTKEATTMISTSTP